VDTQVHPYNGHRPQSPEFYLYPRLVGAAPCGRPTCHLNPIQRIRTIYQLTLHPCRGGPTCPPTCLCNSIRQVPSHNTPHTAKGWTHRSTPTVVIDHNHLNSTCTLASSGRPPVAATCLLLTYSRCYLPITHLQQKGGHTGPPLQHLALVDLP
jgi:hypothetical protein